LDVKIKKKSIVTDELPAMIRRRFLKKIRKKLADEGTTQEKKRAGVRVIERGDSYKVGEERVLCSPDGDESRAK